MKKLLKYLLITIGGLVIIAAIAGFFGWRWVNSTFLAFEKDYKEVVEFETITVDGEEFLDRNANGELDVYEDHRATLDDRIANVLDLMTIEEKIHLLKGSGMASGVGRVPAGEGIPGAVGTIVPTPRLGLPTVYLSDGPAGLRILPTREGSDETFYCTAFPIATVLASTWNTDLVEQVGQSMGNEAKEYGIDVILGPGANLHRHPLCGRNFEYYSEDPLITGKMGAAMVRGIEGQGVGTSVKHFVANNQETNRTNNDARVSERALRELYLKGFEIVVKEAQPSTIMSSYNKINGTQVAEDRRILTDILRGEWGYEGLVMSDWFGGKDAVAMVNAGNDLLEPGTKRQWDALIEGYENGTLDEQNINTSTERILRFIFETAKMKGGEITNAPDLEAHASVTRQSATEGMILLKNDNNVLPLQTTQEVALIGANSFQFIAGGTGSGDVNEAYSVSLQEGLANAGVPVNEDATAVFENAVAANPEAFDAPEGITAMFNPYQAPQLEYSAEQYEQFANSSDVAILTIGRNAGEGGDRVIDRDFKLTPAELDMLDKTCESFHAKNKPVIVVLNVGGVVETASWKSKPDAILLAWQGGQEGGNSVADLLVGKVSPSGKLTMTFPVAIEDHWSNKNFPLSGGSMKMTDMLLQKETPEEEWVKNVDYTEYEEDIYVGYRHFDKANLEVSYPFGYGLSYTSFEYANPTIELLNDTIFAQVTVQNIGSYDGKEVVQLYSSFESEDRPKQELRAFAKTDLLPAGGEQVISFAIPVSNLKIWDEESDQWTLPQGEHQIHIAASSRDHKYSEEISL
jgi:beta-glucosidase